ncbi:hypothetical protein TURU_124174 [Turdus rufiventris]|nr:hypothetical protein TURU_124174 [Turdus rufiventris]
MAETLLNALEDWNGTIGAEEGILEDHGYPQKKVENAPHYTDRIRLTLLGIPYYDLFCRDSQNVQRENKHKPDVEDSGSSLVSECIETSRQFRGLCKGKWEPARGVKQLQKFTPARSLRASAICHHGPTERRRASE